MPGDNGKWQVMVRNDQENAQKWVTGNGMEMVGNWQKQ